MTSKRGFNRKTKEKKMQAQDKEHCMCPHETKITRVTSDMSCTDLMALDQLLEMEASTT